jgi:hypothetical protein
MWRLADGEFMDGVESVLLSGGQGNHGSREFVMSS